MGLSALGIEYGTYVLVASIFLLLLTGQPLAWVTGLVALLFTFGWFGGNALPLVTSRIFGFITEYSLVAIPMFILMAALLDRSGIAKDLFNGMRILAGRLPGGVAIQTLIVAILMAAMSGVIGGEIVLLGILALPQMLRLGYDRDLSIGVVCAGGSLGTMMPPSIVLIIYGLVAGVSIADLFVAAITPALLLLACYIGYVLFRCLRNPGTGAAHLGGGTGGGIGRQRTQGSGRTGVHRHRRPRLDLWRHCLDHRGRLARRLVGADHLAASRRTQQAHARRRASSTRSRPAA